MDCTFVLACLMTWQLDAALKRFEMQNFLVSLQWHVSIAKDLFFFFFSVKKEYKAKLSEKAGVVNLMEPRWHLLFT